MTEAEREMMNTIHLYGLIIALDNDTQKIVLEHFAEYIREDNS